MDSTDTQRSTLKAELLQQIATLGQQQSLLPSDEDILRNVAQQLEALTPIPDPLQLEHRSTLLGTWELIYAPRGTVVTRQLASWTGITINRIWQTLSGGEMQRIAVTNGAALNLPVLGEWRLQAEGVWQWNTDPAIANVTFDAFAFQATQPFNQPDWQLPEVKIPVLEWFRNEALWNTSYLDSDLRFGRGVTGNFFVFRRVDPAG